jgi:class 3 adenylate cyclase
MGRMLKKSLDAPDQRLDLEWLSADVVQLADSSIARTEMRPGARCSLTVGGGSCPAHHAGFMLSGHMRVQSDDGSIIDFGPNDVFDVSPGHDGWTVGDEPVVFVNWNGFRTWMPDAGQSERVLLTLLFTDIVGSTERVSTMGDGAWRELLAAHNHAVRGVLDRFRGREIATTGDGFFAVFDGAARAIQAAVAIRSQARDLGIEIRQGVHTGEVELAGSDLRGVAVHEAARVAAAAGPGEILASATTYALAAGGGLGFAPAGEHELKGISGARTLYRVTAADTVAAAS